MQPLHIARLVTKPLMLIAGRLAHWTIPPGFQAILRSHLNRVNSNTLTPELRAVLQRNREFHSLHTGGRCFILATGPSIKQQNLKLLESETCIAVSNFFVHPDYAVIKPRYYCITAYHPPITEEAWQSWLAEMSKGTRSATMFFSLTDQERVERKGFFANRKVHYLKFGERQDMLVRHGVDITRAVLGPQSVPIMALQLAIYMGFRQIHLLGCDHDNILHFGTSSHFYTEDKHAMMRTGYNEWDGVDMELLLTADARLWQQYKAIRRVAGDKSTKIYNATPGGLLDVFPRVNYESLFEKNISGSLTDL